MTHTPTPWAVTNGKPRKITANGVLICTAVLRNSATTAQNKCGKGEEQAAANAARIVRAVNNHDALVEALSKIAKEARKTKPDPDKIYAWSSDAIARAKGDVA